MAQQGRLQPKNTSNIRTLMATNAHLTRIFVTEDATGGESGKMLIRAELVDVACGVMSANELMDAALISCKAGGDVEISPDMRLYRPRTMSFTDCLGVELLVLEKPAIEALTTLRSNLTMTRLTMDQIGIGTSFGYLKATWLSNQLKGDMIVLSATFGHIAPDCMLKLPGKEPELATEIMNKAAKMESERKER